MQNTRVLDQFNWILNDFIFSMENDTFSDEKAKLFISAELCSMAVIILIFNLSAVLSVFYHYNNSNRCGNLMIYTIEYAI